MNKYEYKDNVLRVSREMVERLSEALKEYDRADEETDETETLRQVANSAKKVANECGEIIHSEWTRNSPAHALWPSTIAELIQPAIQAALAQARMSQSQQSATSEDACFYCNSCNCSGWFDIDAEGPTSHQFFVHSSGCCKQCGSDDYVITIPSYGYTLDGKPIDVGEGYELVPVGEIETEEMEYFQWGKWNSNVCKSNGWNIDRYHSGSIRAFRRKIAPR